MAEFIYSMYKARKAHGDKVILDNVTLAFLPGAKIGVVGPNGAGKSSVLRIMAGVDTPSNGEASLSPGGCRAPSQGQCRCTKLVSSPQPNVIVRESPVGRALKLSKPL